MKISTKDLWAGGILMLLAFIGLYINGGLLGFGLEQHTLGSARRMGPGYMPMLVFWLQFGLGAMVFILALTNGPDPLEPWTKLDLTTLAISVAVGIIIWRVMEGMGVTTNYVQVGIACFVALLVLSISPAWRPLGLVLASFAIFALLLEPLGLMLSITALCVISALADREHNPISIVGMSVFLCILCWFVFIYELDIRVPLWPTIFG
ncbi:tripartite tricarboxylate transporter TctB family protein [Roseomonas sp. SSH11]|uniref:Tripartite tricarboxylate transporter TctB family protein n=1 Tax=Pararoseomonas baculiformis TaxID=2820812 RepID=A0ABS4AGL6_9PROT|nr:tripartite tricarboxylate transporter TctB family protein [Pararoseomonas baculiformis]MBP0446150.1 tripartite tricarboxylate transporter TctB family protein [Pararoseomonas baculiformis]